MVCPRRRICARSFNKRSDFYGSIVPCRQIGSFVKRSIYQQRGDQDGLAEAYRQYALFLLSPAVTHSDYAFVQYGFTDKTISFKTRYAKSVEYFEKAEALYQSIGGTERA